MGLSGGDNRSEDDHNGYSEVVKYIKKLETRIENLEKQNNDLKAERKTQMRQSEIMNDSTDTSLRLNAATPEFRPTNIGSGLYNFFLQL